MHKETDEEARRVTERAHGPWITLCRWRVWKRNSAKSTDTRQESGATVDVTVVEAGLPDLVLPAPGAEFPEGGSTVRAETWRG